MAVREPVKKFRAFVAAARQITVTSNVSVKETVTKRAAWQEDIWPYYDEVPEVKYALNFLANGLAKVRFFAGVRAADGKTIIPIDSEGSALAGTAIAKQANLEMSRIRNGLSGQGEINRLLTLNLEGPGECSLHGVEAIEPSGEPGTADYDPGRAESWDVRSVSEVEVTGQETIDPITGVRRPKIIIRKTPEDKGRVFDPENETLIRFWQRHPRYTEWADSLLRGCMSDCEMLTLLTGEAKAISKSRHNSGAFTLPSELSFDDDTEAGEGQEDSDDKANPFVEAFMKHQVDPVTDPSSPAAVQRLIISGPAEFLDQKYLHTIDLSRPADDKLTEKIDRHINRLARGLNVPVEVVLGHMETTFSNAAQIDQDTFDDHFEPRCVSIADGYCHGFLRPQLESSGEFEIESISLVEVGFDPSDLVRDKSMDEKADGLYKDGVISAEAYRRYKGATEADAPDDIESLLWMITSKGSFDPTLTGALLVQCGIDIGIGIPALIGQRTIDTISSDTPNVEGADAEPAPEAIAASARRRNDHGRQLADIDRTLRTRVHGAADMAMNRALERAGNVLRTAKPTATRAAAAKIPARRLAAHLGPALIAEAGFTVDELLHGAFDDLGEQYKRWCVDAGQRALDVLHDRNGKMTTSRREALSARQASSINDSWTFLQARLREIAKAALFAPDAITAAGAGESDPSSLIPTGVLREAGVIAGGATGYHSKDGVLTPTNNVPLGGIATGEDMMDNLAEDGTSAESYVWDYGPAARNSFPPHEELDGTEFTNFDDDVLANDLGWPEADYFYPGDHEGCVCDFTMILADTPSIDAGADTFDAGDVADLLDLATATDEANAALEEYHNLLYGEGATEDEINAAQAKFNVAGAKMKALREAAMDAAPAAATSPVDIARREIDNASRDAYQALVSGQGKLDREVRDALQVYEGEGYRNINAGGSQYRDEVDAIKAAMTPLGQKTTLYRGVTDIETLTDGSVITSKGFVSTTTDANLGGSFSRSSGGVLGMNPAHETPTVMRITTSAARKALAIPNSPELEVLLPPGTKLKIVGRTTMMTPSGLVNVVEVTA